MTLLQREPTRTAPTRVAPLIALAVWLTLAITAATGNIRAEESNTLLSADWVLAPPSAQTPATRATDGRVSMAWQVFAGTNAAPATNAAPKAIEDFQALLTMARQRRKQLQFAEATSLYADLVESAAPQALQIIAMIEMAEVAQEQNEPLRAQQVYAQCLARWPQDPIIPEILLRQGLVYRQMGLHNLAIAKLYAVMTTALVIKSDRFDYYQQVVLRAQNEIAETQYELGNYAEAVDSFSRLLKLEPPPVNRAAIQYRFIHCLASLGRRGETIAQAQDFLTRYPADPERPEVHFLCATALKQAGRENEALAQVLALLQEQCGGTNCTSQTLAYWQRRAGNDIANQFYQQGDALKALQIYQRLAAIESDPEWQLPVWYQIGLAFERLGQPAKALEYYGSITGRVGEITGTASPGLKTLVEMATWRKDFLAWQVKTEAARMAFGAAALGTSAADPPAAKHP